MQLLCASIASALLLVNPPVLVFAMCRDTTCSTTYVATLLAVCINAETPQAVEKDRKIVNRDLITLRIDDLLWTSGEVGQ